MEFYSDEDERNGFDNPCYAAYDAVGERMCEAFKEQRFHNDPEHLLAPSMKRALQAYDRALNELSYGLNIQLPGCCYRRSNSSHCFQRTNEQNCSCRRNHDDYSRLVEVVDVGSSTVDIDVPDGEKIVKTLNTNTSDEETRISSILPQEGIHNISDKTLLMTPSPPLSWRVEKATEEEMEVGQSVQICEETLNDFHIETSPIDQNLDVCEIPKSSEIAEKLSSTSENRVVSAREKQATCHRELCEDGIKRDTDRNITINVKVKIHKRKKKSVNEDNVNKPKKSGGKPKGQEENKKHDKKLPKYEITKPIIVCNKSPESGMKFFKFFKCKRFNKKPTDKAGKLCTCEEEQERKSNPKTPSSTMDIFNTSIRSQGSDNISTKQLTSSIVEGKNGHMSEKRSRLSGKNSSQNHRTSGSGAKLSEGAESNQMEKAGLQKISRSKRSVGKTQSERSSGLLKDHDKPDTSGKKGQIGTEKKSKQRQQKLKNDKPKLSSHPEQKRHASKSNHKNSNVKRDKNNKHEKVSSEVYEHGTGSMIKQKIEQVLTTSLQFCKYKNGNCIFFEQSCRSYSHKKWIDSKRRLHYYFGTETKLLRMKRITQLMKHNRNEELHRPLYKPLPNIFENNTKDLTFDQSDIDRDIYDLREIFKTFGVYKQQQFLLEYERQCYNQMKMKMEILQYRPVKKKRLPIRSIEHLILTLYLIIFVWFTFFDQ